MKVWEVSSASHKVCTGSVPGTECCSSQKVSIDGIDPENKVLCDGCQIDLSSSSCRPVEWEVLEDSRQWVEPPYTGTGGQFTVQLVDRLQRGEDEPFVPIVARASDALNPSNYDEFETLLWKMPDNVKLKVVPGVGPMTPAEIALAAQWHPGGYVVAPIRREVEVISENYFKCFGDGTQQNAFVHATTSCKAARTLYELYAPWRGPDFPAGELAETLTNALEEYSHCLDDSPCQDCGQASMDLHNNRVGISVWEDEGECEDLVMQKLLDGDLRWLAEEQPPVCPEYESEADPACLK